jgi:hypothetical protein
MSDLAKIPAALTDWITVTMVLQENPHLFSSAESFRRVCKAREQNGLADAVRVIGGRFLIHRGRLAAWVDQQTDKRPSGRKAKEVAA